MALKIDSSLVPLYDGDVIVASQRRTDVQYLEDRLRLQARAENRHMNDVIRDAVAFYLEAPRGTNAVRASFQRLLKDPPLRASVEMVQQALDEEYYEQKAGIIVRLAR